ncbi:MAG: 1-(5-phosphoribosyl)-5-[(5-phosphoribosylamino)methylideneamino] imidazole-4-carboxamide isomerase, partial [Acidobacteriota bacterium]|nr:1-(5-phosphoribosyl)-5-[(5-phosphoribosylamino)methylideneamino] imidazole-4-carboxamide isomerase [Acidobacteriota bacterium]
MIIPCIDLMGNKVVQLVQGREDSKVLELPDPLQVLERF